MMRALKTFAKMWLTVAGFSLVVLLVGYGLVQALVAVGEAYGYHGRVMFFFLLISVGVAIGGTVAVVGPGNKPTSPSTEE